MDLYSYSPELLYNHQKYKTIPGALMTLISMILIIIFSVIEFKNYLDGTKKSVIFAKEAIFNNTIKLNDILIGYTVYDQIARSIPQNMITVFPVYWQVLDGNPAFYTLLNSTKCINTKKYKEKKKSDTLAISNCLDNNNINITLEQQSSPTISRYVTLYIAKCTNSTENNNSCLPKEEIDKVVDTQALHLALSIENANFNHDNKIPILSDYLTNVIAFSSDYISYNTYKLRNLIYESDDGIITSKINTYNSVIFELYGINEVNFNKGFKMIFPNTLKLVQIGVNENYAEKYTRRYDKIQNVLSDIAGICFSIIKLFAFVTRLITKGFMYKDLSILIINQNEKNKEKKNKASHLKAFKNLFNLRSTFDQKKSNFERSNNEQSKIIVINENNSNIRESQILKSPIHIGNNKDSSKIINKVNNSFDVLKNQIHNDKEMFRSIKKKPLTLIQYNHIDTNENLNKKINKINKLNCFHLLLFPYYYCYYCNRNNKHAQILHNIKIFIDKNISANQIIKKFQAIK